MIQVSTSPLHLVLGDTAAAVLRYAVRNHGVPGNVHCIRDDLAVGPLHDGTTRMKFWRASYVGFDDWLETETDAFATWHSLAGSLSEHPRPLVVWRAQNPSETVLFAMACWWFQDKDVMMLTVEPPDGRHTGIWPAAALAEFSLTPRAVASDERSSHVANFAVWRSDSGVLRAWRDNAVITVPVDTFDDLILDACTVQWQRAHQIVGQAMASTDGRNQMSDVFFSTRLRAMIADGRLEADVPQTGLREYSVRMRSVGQLHRTNPKHR